MNWNRKTKIELPSWGLMLIIIGVGAGITFFGWEFSEEKKTTKELKNDLVIISLDNVRLADSLQMVILDLKSKSSELGRINKKYEREKKAWLEQRETLTLRLKEQEEQISLLVKERDSLAYEKDKLRNIIYNSLDELTLTEIEDLKRQVKKKEEELLQKDQELFDYRRAREMLVDQLREANDKMENNKAFFEEMMVALVDFYNYLSKLENENYSLKNEVNEKIRIRRKKGYTGGPEGVRSIELDIPANELYGGSQFLNNIYQRMYDHKMEVENLRHKQEMIEQMITAYDLNLSYNDDVLESVNRLIGNLEVKEYELLEYEERVRTRFLLIASTKELIEQGILRKKDWRRALFKRKVDLTKVDLSKFKQIDYLFDTIIDIPDTLKIRSVVTTHQNWSYTTDEDLSIVYIKNSKKFWELSSFLIIETE